MQLLRGKKNYESDRVFYLPVTQIVPNRAQPRVHFDEAALAELAGSIRRYGVLQPLTVRRSSGGGFELVAGEAQGSALPGERRRRGGRGAAGSD